MYRNEYRSIYIEINNIEIELVKIIKYIIQKLNQNRLIFRCTQPFNSLESLRSKKKVSYAHQGCIYLIKWFLF